MIKIQDIASVVGDETFLEKIFSDSTKASEAAEEFIEMKAFVAEDSGFAILSLNYVQQMILDKFKM